MILEITGEGKINFIPDVLSVVSPSKYPTNTYHFDLQGSIEFYNKDGKFYSKFKGEFIPWTINDHIDGIETDLSRTTLSDNPEHNYVLNATEYDIAKMIMDCDTVMISLYSYEDADVTAAAIANMKTIDFTIKFTDDEGIADCTYSAKATPMFNY